MKRHSVLIVTIGAVLTAFAAASLTSAQIAKPAPRKAKASNAGYTQQQVARGEYLVTIGGCHDCHTPHKLGPNGVEPDMSRALSGHPENLKMPAAPNVGEGPWVWVGAGTNTAFAGPWGVSYAFNLTPEENTGIGIWTEDMFMKTIRTGRHWGVARPILPPMPWFNYAKMTDADLRAVYAYLRSVRPVKNRVPEAIVAPPPPAAKR